MPKNWNKRKRGYKAEIRIRNVYYLVLQYRLIRNYFPTVDLIRGRWIINQPHFFKQSKHQAAECYNFAHCPSETRLFFYQAIRAPGIHRKDQQHQRLT